MAGKQENTKNTGGKKNRKRQRVTRHYKPSLGRWVENYDRTGENARKKMKAARRGAGESDHDDARDFENETVPPARRGRRLAALVLVVCALAAATTGLLFERAAREPRYEVHGARNPLLVQVRTGSPQDIVFATEGTLNNWVSAGVRDVTKALDKHPGRLVAITFGRAALSYGELAPHEKQTLHVRLARDPATAYESVLVRILLEILDAVEQGRGGATGQLTVRGLPVEPRIIDQATARRTNARYRPVMNRLDPLVSDHAYIMADTSLTEEQMVLAAMPEGLRWRDGRPILFKTNGAWRVLIDEGALENADPAEGAVTGLHALLADPAAAATPLRRGNLVLGSRPGQRPENDH